MSVDKLLSDHGLDGDQTLAWAKERADALVSQLEDPQLRALLEGGDVDLPPARAGEVDGQASSANLPPTPAQADARSQPPTQAAAIDGESEDELEELDMDELEELDMDEVEMVEEEVDTDSDAGEVETSEASSPEYRPTDTQPLEAVDAEIVDEEQFDPSAGFDPAAGDAPDADSDPEQAPVRTGDTDTGMDRQAVLDAAPEQVEDQGSGDLFDEDELDIDIDI